MRQWKKQKGKGSVERIVGMVIGISFKDLFTIDGGQPSAVMA